MKITLTSILFSENCMLATATGHSNNKGIKKGKGKQGKGSKTSFVFVEFAGNEYLQGAENLGGLVLWSNSPIFYVYGETLIAHTVGTCTTVSESPLSSFCNYLLDFQGGDYAGSTLTFQGEYPDYRMDASNTITGGTGSFKGVSGLIITEQPKSADADPLYIHHVQLE
jgi:hypothetical protein